MSPLKSLLQRLRIGAVYWIDDENASDAELDVDKLARIVAESLTLANDDQVKLAIKELKRQASARTLATTIHNRLSSGGEDVADSIAELIVGQISEHVEDPKDVLVRMINVLPRILNAQERQGLVSVFSNDQDWTWRELSFAKWQEQHASIFEQHASNESPALLIVDLQNTREASAISGFHVIDQWAERWAASSGSMAVYVVALTSSYREDQEVVEGRRLTKGAFGDAATSPLPVLVLSKGRLADKAGEADVAQLLGTAFTGALSRLRAFTLHGQLAVLLQALFTASASEAFRVLSELSIEEMLLSVSTSSFIEGASEIDTLVRMASIAQRQSLLAGLVQQEDLRGALIELRGLQAQQGPMITMKDLDSADGLGKLRCSEFHDPAQVVNSLLSPIATGDIYEILMADDSVEHYVLVSNACDLMLRGKTGDRNLDEGLLIRLEESTARQESVHSFRMVAFPVGSTLAGKKIVANLLRISVLPLTVLDLCWTNDRGECVWANDQHASDLLSLLPAQRLRYQKIDQELRGLGDEQLRRFAGAISLRIEHVETTSERRRIEFRMRRVGRLSARFATELSAKVAHTIGRTVREHDFSVVSETS